jgi:hypothetical protein
MSPPYIGIARYQLPWCLLTKHVSSKHHQWRATMDIEFNVLVKNGTWDPKPSYNLVGNKRVFHIKRHMQMVVLSVLKHDWWLRDIISNMVHINL